MKPDGRGVATGCFHAGVATDAAGLVADLDEPLAVVKT
jgi:hypothetical protein